MFSFIAGGLLFSGYLSGVKFFSDTCAFGSTCPIFLGYPACYTGFAVYLVLAIIAIISLFKKEMTRFLLVSTTGLSLFGVLFSGKLTLSELSVLFSDGFVAFVNSLPLCSIGLIVYIVIFILSLSIGKSETEVEKQNEVISPMATLESTSEMPKIEVSEPIIEEVKIEETPHIELAHPDYEKPPELSEENKEAASSNIELK